jgi:hypothetical protein
VSETPSGPGPESEQPEEVAGDAEEQRPDDGAPGAEYADNGYRTDEHGNRLFVSKYTGEEAHVVNRENQQDVRNQLEWYEDELGKKGAGSKEVRALLDDFVRQGLAFERINKDPDDPEKQRHYFGINKRAGEWYRQAEDTYRTLYESERKPGERKQPDRKQRVEQARDDVHRATEQPDSAEPAPGEDASDEPIYDAEAEADGGDAEAEANGGGNDSGDDGGEKDAAPDGGENDSGGENGDRELTAEEMGEFDDTQPVGETMFGHTQHKIRSKEYAEEVRPYYDQGLEHLITSDAPPEKFDQLLADAGRHKIGEVLPDWHEDWVKRLEEAKGKEGEEAGEGPEEETTAEEQERLAGEYYRDHFGEGWDNLSQATKNAFGPNGLRALNPDSREAALKSNPVYRAGQRVHAAFKPLIDNAPDDTAKQELVRRRDEAVTEAQNTTKEAWETAADMLSAAAVGKTAERAINKGLPQAKLFAEAMHEALETSKPFRVDNKGGLARRHKNRGPRVIERWYAANGQDKVMILERRRRSNGELISQTTFATKDPILGAILKSPPKELRSRVEEIRSRDKLIMAKESTAIGKRLGGGGLEDYIDIS